MVPTIISKQITSLITLASHSRQLPKNIYFSHIFFTVKINRESPSFRPSQQHRKMFLAGPRIDAMSHDCLWGERYFLRTPHGNSSVDQYMYFIGKLTLQLIISHTEIAPSVGNITILHMQSQQGR